MAYPIDKKLVIAVASSALFDLSDSDTVYQQSRRKDPRLETYREYQRKKENVRLQPGVAFPLVRRLLLLNEGFDEVESPVEVVLLSQNDPDTGLRVMNSIEKHGLKISRAVFVNGANAYKYMRGMNASLFLSADEKSVRSAVERGLPAGRVFPTQFTDNPDDPELRIAFDFDGIVADDSSEALYRKSPRAFRAAEVKQALKPLKEGPLGRFFKEVSRLQRLERDRKARNKEYTSRLRTAIVTARNAPAHKRVVSTLRKWGIEVDEVFFLGGIDKSRILADLKPHIFFDDQLKHVLGAAEVTPSAHVPFGVANKPSPDLIRGAFKEYARLKERRRYLAGEAKPRKLRPKSTARAKKRARKKKKR